MADRIILVLSIDTQHQNGQDMKHFPSLEFNAYEDSVSNKPFSHRCFPIKNEPGLATLQLAEEFVSEWLGTKANKMAIAAFILDNMAE